MGKRGELICSKNLLWGKKGETRKNRPRGLNLRGTPSPSEGEQKDREKKKIVLTGSESKGCPLRLSGGGPGWYTKAGGGGSWDFRRKKDKSFFGRGKKKGHQRGLMVNTSKTKIYN